MRNEVKRKMFDKSISLNMKIAFNEFAIGLGISVLSQILMMAGGWLPLAALAGFLASLVFFIMGFIKLFYKSLFSNEAYLYMSLPISNLHMIIGKVLVGTLWLSLWGVILIGAVIFPSESNFFETFIGTLLLQGLPAENAGPLMVLLLWTYLCGLALLCAALLFSIIFANTLTIRRFKIAANFFTLLLVFAVNKGIHYAAGKVLESTFDPFSKAFEISLFGLILTSTLLALFILLSERLLTKRYNLS